MDIIYYGPEDEIMRNQNKMKSNKNEKIPGLGPGRDIIFLRPVPSGSSAPIWRTAPPVGLLSLIIYIYIVRELQFQLPASQLPPAAL